MTRTVLASLIALLATSSLFAQTPEAIQRGQKVYAAEKCSICHAIDGESLVAFLPSLQQRPAE